jgi:hypothetical protein
MLDSCVLPIVSCRKINVELIFMQGGAPSYFALPVRTWLDSHFTSWWIGGRGETENSRYYVLTSFLFVRLAQRGSLSKPRPLHGLNNILEIILELFLLISWGKVLGLCFTGCTKLCDMFSNVAFRLADIARICFPSFLCVSHYTIWHISAVLCFVNIAEVLYCEMTFWKQ